VTDAPSSEQRKATTPAMSAGFASRCIGTWLIPLVSTDSDSIPSFAPKLAAMFLSVGPVAMAATRTPRVTYSMATDFLRPTTPCLLAA